MEIGQFAEVTGGTVTRADIDHGRKYLLLRPPTPTHPPPSPHLQNRKRTRRADSRGGTITVRVGSDFAFKLYGFVFVQASPYGMCR